MSIIIKFGVIYRNMPPDKYLLLLFSDPKKFAVTYRRLGKIPSNDVRTTKKDGKGNVKTLII
jgi:hypothetical protein